jgi:hypothetical protein
MPMFRLRQVSMYNKKTLQLAYQSVLLQIQKPDNAIWYQNYYPELFQYAAHYFHEGGRDIVEVTATSCGLDGWD